MNIEIFIGYVIISMGVILVPGPNVLLIVSNSLTYGVKRGLQTVAGTSLAIAIQLTITSLGMTSLMLVLVDAFEWIRWLGVIYLIYIGVKLWYHSFDKEDDRKIEVAWVNQVFWQGFFVSLTNPKTMLFFTAFLPQFIDFTKPIAIQMLILSLTFLMIATLFDSFYAMTGGKLSHFLVKPQRVKLGNRISGTLLISTGIGLGFMGRK